MSAADGQAATAAHREHRGVLAAGTRVGVYEIVSILGHGAFGVTYRARNVAQDLDVAIKEYFPASLALREADSTVLPRSTDVSDEFVWGRERFVEEERTLAKLTGAPAVVRVLDFIEANGTAYMVMALVEGETLDLRLMRDGRLSQEDLDRILAPLLDGLEQVHDAGFLHRDIKPANIIIDAAGVPTLIDFGAARAALVGRTQTLTAVFTPGYAPIEQFTSRQQGPYTDIYALGATLYQCVAGRVPPSAIDRTVGAEMKSAIELGRGGYTLNLLAGIDAALVTDAAERPQSIAQWREVFASGIGPDAVATRVILKTPTTAPRRRGLWIGAVAALLLVVAMAGYVALQLASPPDTMAADAVARDKAEAQRRQAELENRVKEAETARRAAEDDRARIEQEQKAQEEARQKAEAEAAQKRQADDDAKRKAEAELAEKKRIEDEEKAKVEAAAKSADEIKRVAEREETALRLGETDRQKIQAALTSLGFPTGGTDGNLGPRSRQMIAAWQQKSGAPATGFLSAAQRDQLWRSAAPAITKWEEEQKKLEDEKKKAEEEKKKVEAAKAVAAPPATSPTAPAQSAQSGTDVWTGRMYCRFPATGNNNFEMDINVITINGQGSGQKTDGTYMDQGSYKFSLKTTADSAEAEWTGLPPNSLNNFTIPCKIPLRGKKMESEINVSGTAFCGQNRGAMYNCRLALKRLNTYR